MNVSDIRKSLISRPRCPVCSDLTYVSLRKGKKSFSCSFCINCQWTSSHQFDEPTQSDIDGFISTYQSISREDAWLLICIIKSYQPFSSIDENIIQACETLKNKEFLIKIQDDFQDIYICKLDV